MPKFFNLTQFNNTDTNVPLSLEQNFNLPILDKASDYDVSIVAFNLPNYQSPLFKFLDNTYQMTLTYNNISVSEYVPYNMNLIGLQNKNIYVWQQFVYMLNETITLLYWDLNQLTNISTHTIPFFSYDVNAGLMTLTAPLGDYYVTPTPFYNQTPPPIVTKSDIINFDPSDTPFKLFINNSLLTKIGGFPIKGYSTDQIHYIFQLIFISQNNNINNTSGTIILSQEEFPIDNIVDASKIVVQTNLPIQSELQDSSTYLPILTDFNLTDISIRTFHSRIIYNPPGPPYRQASLCSDAPLHSLICKCFIKNNAPFIGQDFNSSLIPMNIGPFQSASIKLMFTKKRENKYA